MNTRMVVTTRAWFGGGADLTPMLDRRRTQEDPDTQAFHAAMESACAPHPVADYAPLQGVVRRLFLPEAPQRARGIGGIFYDYLDSGDRSADFAFTRAVGEASWRSIPRSCGRTGTSRGRRTSATKQLVRRGRYVEFNLVYDRGTLFGLKTGGNVEAILSSMPPTVAFP